MIKPTVPPWVKRNEAHLWFTAKVAARFYFNKSPRTVLRYCLTGYYAENGIETFFDGKIWFLRLPELFEAGQPRYLRQPRKLSA